MTKRALLLGVGLAFCVSALSYANDHILRQTLFIGTHLPPSVFGFGLLLLFVLNPILGSLRGRVEPLRPSEVTLVVALGLAACPWPGSNFMRHFTHFMVVPAHQYPTRPNWQATNVLSYIPGQSPLLAEGYVSDWSKLVADLRRGSAPDAPSGLSRLWPLLDEPVKRRLAGPNAPWGPDEKRLLLRDLNRLIQRADLRPIAADLSGAPTPVDGADADTVADENRRILESVLGGLRSRPLGAGVLLTPSARGSAAMATLHSAPASSPSNGIPVDVWHPTLRLWIGVAALVGIAVVCLMVMVHPQWTHNEQLPYPIPRFFEIVAERSGSRRLPDVAVNRGFWVTLLLVVAFHLVNGTHTWVTGSDGGLISRQADITGLKQLMPLMSKTSGSGQFFHPMLLPAVIGFGYLVNPRVALSIGLALPAWMFMASLLLLYGVPVLNAKTNLEAVGPQLRFGAYLAVLLMILYYGRAYYAKLSTAMVGVHIRSDVHVPRYAVWAGRLMVVAVGLTVGMLVHYANFTVLLAALFVLVLFTMFVVMARVSAETGLFYLQPDWLPGAALLGIFGVYGAGLEATAVVLLASQVLAADPREAAAPFLANALRLSDRAGQIPVARVAPALGAVVLLSLVTCAAVTLSIQHARGLDPHDPAPALMARNTIDTVANAANTLSWRGEITDATRRSSIEQLLTLQPSGPVILCMSVGLLLALSCSWAKLIFAWWPLHPVLFLVWGTYPAGLFGPSLLLAACIRGALTSLGGIRAYATFRPAMIGLIVGDVGMILFWWLAGAAYFCATSQTPTSYYVIPY